MKKNRIIAETGAGQHGVAVATVCARFGFECVIYMGKKDIERQKSNVFKIKLLGGQIVPVESGNGTLKDALRGLIVTCVELTKFFKKFFLENLFIKKP